MFLCPSSVLLCLFLVQTTCALQCHIYRTGEGAITEKTCADGELCFVAAKLGKVDKKACMPVEEGLSAGKCKGAEGLAGCMCDQDLCNNDELAQKAKQLSFSKTQVIQEENKEEKEEGEKEEKEEEKKEGKGLKCLQRLYEEKAKEVKCAVFQDRCVLTVIGGMQTQKCATQFDIECLEVENGCTWLVNTLCCCDTPLCNNEALKEKENQYKQQVKVTGDPSTKEHAASEKEEKEINNKGDGETPVDVGNGVKCHGLNGKVDKCEGDHKSCVVSFAKGQVNEQGCSSCLVLPKDNCAGKPSSTDVTCCCEGNMCNREEKYRYIDVYSLLCYDTSALGFLTTAAKVYCKADEQCKIRTNHFGGTIQSCAKNTACEEEKAEDKCNADETCCCSTNLCNDANFFKTGKPTVVYKAKIDHLAPEDKDDKPILLSPNPTPDQNSEAARHVISVMTSLVAVLIGRFVLE